MMDREQALRLLRGGKEGVRKWNQFKQLLKPVPSLESAELSEVDLMGADLFEVDLAKANLRGANLVGAELGQAYLAKARMNNCQLTGANLTLAHLTGAQLRGADLGVANLFEADLSGADLRGTLLINARFLLTKLSRCRMTEAKCGRTVFAGVDLSETEGLESVSHLSPSSLGLDTLVESRGEIPALFLRGCGVPDQWIEHLPSLIGMLEPIQFYSSFISHSSKDGEFARRLHSRLVQENLRVWFAPEDLKGGRKTREQLEGAIRIHDKLLLVLSKASMESSWVEHEIRTALRREAHEKRQVLFPIRLASWKDVKAWTCFDSDTGTDMANQVREYHIPDFARWKDHDSFETAFARLLNDLKAEINSDRAKLL